MKASEYREKSVDELNQELNSQLEQQFKLRMQASTGQLGSERIKLTAEAAQEYRAGEDSVRTQKAGE